jgi:hypothetical protein
MCEDEHADARRPRKLGRVKGGRVEGLVGPLALLRGEGRLVDEHVSLVRRLEHRTGGPGVPREHDLASRPRRPQHVLRAHHAPLPQLDRLARLEPSEERALRDAERQRALDVEAPWPWALDERVTVRRDAVLDLEGSDPVVAPLDGVARNEFHEVDLVGQLPEDTA